jgi:hypothetical protein
MENFYKIDIFDKRTGKNTEESGIYFGELCEILSRLDFSINEIDRELTVTLVTIKSIDMHKPTHKVDFTCYDSSVDLSFAEKFNFGHFRC